MTQTEASSEEAVRELRVPSGWYPDPPLLRYWNGSDWSEETRPAGPPRRNQRVVEPRTTVQALAAWREDRPRRGPSPVVVLANFSPIPVETVPESRVVLEPVVVAEPRVAPVPVPAPQEPRPARTSETSESSEQPHVLRELGMFALVALMAIGIAAVVAAIGIAFTV